MIRHPLHLLPTLLAPLLLVASTGCASIMHGSTQQIAVSSTPSRADVTVNGQELGVTPVVANLARKDTHTIAIRLAGYEDYEITLTRSVSGWVWGNIVFGGIIGLAVDAITGGLYKLSPEQVMAEMRDRPTTLAADEGGTLFLTVVLRADPNWRSVGQMEGSED